VGDRLCIEDGDRLPTLLTKKWAFVQIGSRSIGV
jgi:hypothetical protein